MGCGGSVKQQHAQGDAAANKGTSETAGAATAANKGASEAQQPAQGDAAANKGASETAGAATAASTDTSKAGASGTSNSAAAPAQAGYPQADTSAKAQQAATKDDEDEDEDEDDQMDDEEFERRMKQHQNRDRGAISAEQTQRDPDWKPPKHEKTDAQKERLKTALSKSFMFAALPPADLESVIESFQEVSFDPEVTVIKQGDSVAPDAQALYVIESGNLEVFKDGVEAKVFTYTEAGQYFGDLACLYNAPRAATVIAKEKSVCWSIDRNTFNFLVKDAARSAVERRKAFLENVPLLQGLKTDEIASLCDALNVMYIKKDELIIRQGDEGKEFFIIEKGTCVAKKDDVMVKELKERDYFGEMALLNNDGRLASVFAGTEGATVLALDQGAFRRLLGPLDQLMRSRATEYQLVGTPIEQVKRSSLIDH